MKKHFIKICLVLSIVTIMALPSAASAASHSFSFDFSHNLWIGDFTSTKGSVTGKVNITSWGGDNYFTIHVYTTGWDPQLVTRLGFEKSSSGSPYYDTDYSVTTGHTYDYELWKNVNGKYIKGSGSLSY